MMTVKELKERLATMPDDADVYVSLDGQVEGIGNVSLASAPMHADYVVIFGEEE